MTKSNALKNMKVRLQKAEARLKELLSYLPKVPTQPYEKSLAEENIALKKEITTFKAKLWVARDSQLRTYDGLAQKADAVDSYATRIKQLRLALQEIVSQPDADLISIAKAALQVDEEAE